MAFYRRDLQQSKSNCPRVSLCAQRAIASVANKSLLVLAQFTLTLIVYKLSVFSLPLI